LGGRNESKHLERTGKGGKNTIDCRPTFVKRPKLAIGLREERGGEGGIRFVTRGLRCKRFGKGFVRDWSHQGN